MVSTEANMQLNIDAIKKTQTERRSKNTYQVFQILKVKTFCICQMVQKTPRSRNLSFKGTLSNIRLQIYVNCSPIEINNRTNFSQLWKKTKHGLFLLLAADVYIYVGHSLVYVGILIKPHLCKWNYRGHILEA
jgi:hypothetical protein